MEDYSFQNAETRYKIETADRKQLELYLKSNAMVCALYDIICWRRAIYNGKNYGEGSVIYKGKLYSKDEWTLMKHSDDEYDENHYFKEKPIYCYTEKDIERKLDELLNDISGFVYDYME